MHIASERTMGPKQQQIFEAAKRAGLLEAHSSAVVAREAYHSWCRRQRQVYVAVLVWPVRATVLIDLEPAGLEFNETAVKDMREFLLSPA